MITYMPYIVTILCSIISGFASFFAARRQAKAEMQKLQKKYELDIEKERELFAMEKEKMELEHRHQLELKQKEVENQLGANLTNAFITEAMKMPEIRQQFAHGVRNGSKKR